MTLSDGMTFVVVLCGTILISWSVIMILFVLFEFFKLIRARRRLIERAVEKFPGLSEEQLEDIAFYIGFRKDNDNQ